MAISLKDTLEMTATQAQVAEQADLATESNALVVNEGGIGDAYTPVYFNSSGEPVALNFSIKTSVPANAIILDGATGAGSNVQPIYFSKGRPYAVSYELNSTVPADAVINTVSTNVGSATQPVYIANGTPVATTYTLAKSVPSDAKFTDTVTTATTSGTGNAVTSITANNGALTVTKGATFSLSGHTHSASEITGISTLISSTTVASATNATLASSATMDASGNTITSTYATLNSPALTGTPTAPTANANTSSTQIATTAFVESEISSKIASADAMIYKGTLGTDGTVTSLPNTTAKTGWTYKVITAGTYSGNVCEIGDMVICLTDGSSSIDATWNVVQSNLDGVVTGPSGATDGNFALFDGATGKIIKNSSYSPSSFASATHTHSYVPTSTGVTHTANTSVGGTTTPVYVTSAGVITAGTPYASATVLSATNATNANSATYATSATNADSATNAGSATDATSAGSATHATNADSATNAGTASKIGTTTVGGTSTPVYVSNGTVVSATPYASATVLSATNASNATSATSAGFATSAGSVAWTSVTDKPSTFTPSAHNHNSSEITAMTSYSKASSNSAIAVADALNVAVGKLEYKADNAISRVGTVEGYFSSGVATSATNASVASSVTGSINGFTVSKSVPSDAKFTDTVTTVTTSGTGNAVTSVSASNGALTITKGTTFLTSHQDISGKANAVTNTSGTAGTSTATSGSTLAVPYVTVNTQGVVTGYGTHTHTITGFATSNTVTAIASTTGSGNAVTSITASNGQLTVTKGTTFLTSHQDISGKQDVSTAVTHTASTGVGGTTTPVYVTSAGVATACTPYASATVLSATNATIATSCSGSVNGFTVSKSVPSTAVFTDTDTKNTAGTTNTTSKIFLIGATSQASSATTYSDANVYTTNGTLRATNVNVADKVTLQWNATTESLDFVFA